MSLDVLSLIRPNIRALRPYRAARHDNSEGILLDANENPYGDLVDTLGVRLNRYPDPLQTRLRERLAKLDRVSPEQIVAGAGADEIIDLLLRLFCAPGGEMIAIAEPTYGMYRVAAAINDIAVRSIRLDERFRLDPATTLAELGPEVKLFICCSPNNPTGSVIPRDAIVDICRGFRGIVVVDEAYIDFADTPSLSDLVATTPNLLLLRTLSKGYGLAALRIGYAIGTPEIIEHLFRIKPPYNIGALNAAAALAALERIDAIAARVALIKGERKRLAERLARLDVIERVWPSQGNFLLVRTRDAKSFCRDAARHGVIVRDRSDDPLLANCVRITVGTPEENELLLAAAGRMAR